MAYGTGASFPSALPTNQELLQWANGAETTLSVAISAADTSIVLADGSLFPSEAFEISIDSEIIKINSRSGNTCSVGSRGYDGTTAASHTPPAIVRANYTRWHHDRVAAELVAVCAAAGISFGGIVAYHQRMMVSGDGNYTVPAYVTASSILEVILVAGGGGGAGATTNKGGGGGGAGEIMFVYLTGLTAGATITNTYGAAGSAGGINTQGGNGGATTIAGTWTGSSSGPMASPISATGGGGGGHWGGDVKLGGYSGAALLTHSSLLVDGAGGSEAIGPYELALSGAGASGQTTANQIAYRGSGPNSKGSYVAAQASIYKGGGGGGNRYGFPGRPTSSGTGGASSTMNGVAGQGYGAGGGGGSYDAGTASAGTGSVGLPGCILFRIVKV